MDVNVISNEDAVVSSNLQGEPKQDLSNGEIKFARRVVGRKETLAFDQFVDFLITGEGTKYLEVLKREGINLTNVSTFLG